MTLLSPSRFQLQENLPKTQSKRLFDFLDVVNVENFHLLFFRDILSLYRVLMLFGLVYVSCQPLWLHAPTSIQSLPFNIIYSSHLSLSVSLSVHLGHNFILIPMTNTVTEGWHNVIGIQISHK